MLLCHAIIQNNTKQTNAAAFVPVWISTVIMDKKYNNYNTGKKYSIQTIIKIFGWSGCLCGIFKPYNDDFMGRVA